MHRKTNGNRYATALLLLTATLAPKTIHAQWDIEESHTTASLRGIHNVGGGVAWASGTNGTVLRTEDGGYLWQTCNIPPGAEKLDFRGIQAFDENTAIVMSSGKGDLSRLYKTTDGCQTWKLLFTNPDKDGFWDAIQFVTLPGDNKGRIGYIIGDPVHGKFAEFITYKSGEEWFSSGGPGAELASANNGEAIFAASNTSMILVRNSPLFVTGGTTSRSRTLELHVKHDPTIFWNFVGGTLPLQHGASAGAFSVGANLGPDSVAAADAAKFIEKPTHVGDSLVAVGGDYLKPNDSTGTAAFTADGGEHWTASTTPPHGYRSAVAYDPTQKLWITVGPNGTDISTDDGKNWRPLAPSGYDPPDADKNWNALSLPFVVGPHGRIGKLRPITQNPDHPK
jgi:photosystem II stability/assembly factor-like uncharacterized protein